MSDSKPKLKRGRQPTGVDAVIFPVRLSRELAESINAIVESYGTDGLGHPNISRSEIMRRFLEEGVERHRRVKP